MVAESRAPLSAAVSSFGELGLYAGRAGGPVVGRARELEAVRRGYASARAGMVCIVLDGEAGIGKTRLLVAAEEIGRAEGFLPIAVTTDEEIRGPFLLARSLFGCPSLLEAAEGTPAVDSVRRAVDALANRDDPGFESLPGDRRLVRIFDIAAEALRALAAEQPVALLIDDVQWADEDSLRMLRYLVRTYAASPILLVLATRPDETAFVNEAVTLLADMDRIGILHRVRLRRFSRLESTELLQQVLGAQLEPSTAAVMHAQAEGVPFILAEQALAYRDAGLVQQVDGVWTLAQNAQRLLPSAVRTLIQRRAARLPDDTKVALGEAAVLGRNFSLRDLAEIRQPVGGRVADADELTSLLAPAVAVGLLTQHPHGSAADYTFTHEHVREFAASTLPPARRRGIHAAIVEMLTRGGEPLPESLPLLAQHALAAGDDELTARASIQAAQAALHSNAPEEALRLVDLAQPVASRAQDRVALLCLRDDALGMLRRAAQRLEGLTELAALAEALGDTELEQLVLLRRASAFRLSEDYDLAASLARRVRERATSSADEPLELAACMELGQDLLQSDLGDATTQTPMEADLDGAEEAFERAATLADSLDDDASVAAATRELGVISASRVRAGFIEAVRAGDHLKILSRLTAGETLDGILPELPIAPFYTKGMERYGRALEIYEKLGDRQGTMSTIIAMATLSWAPHIHLIGSPNHIEEIRKLWTQMKSVTRQSERALADAQMLFGAHVYARDRQFADAALAKGLQAYDAARVLGERGLEFVAAGGVALQHARLGDIDEANAWLERAASVATSSPTPSRALQIELWRGMVHWADDDGAGMREHLERAVSMAADRGQAAARCEALARLALAASWLGVDSEDDELMAIAQRAAMDAKSLSAMLPGHPPWGAEADAALARVALQKGEREVALTAARSCFDVWEGVHREDLPLEMMLAAAGPLLREGTHDEQEATRHRLRLLVTLIAQRIADEDVRSRWFRSRVGRELALLAGPLDALSAEAGPTSSVSTALDDAERALLRLVIQGRTNSEIAAESQSPEDAIAPRLAMLFTKIGASSRAEAMAAALTQRLV